MLLMVEKRIRGGRHPYVTLSVRYGKTKKQIYDKNKELSYLKYRDAKNLYGRALSQKLQVNGFK